jgi:hypothetical protein
MTSLSKKPQWMVRRRREGAPEGGALVDLRPHDGGVVVSIRIWFAAIDWQTANDLVKHPTAVSYDGKMQFILKPHPDGYTAKTVTSKSVMVRFRLRKMDMHSKRELGGIVSVDEVEGEKAVIINCYVFAEEAELAGKSEFEKTIARATRKRIRAS